MCWIDIIFIFIYFLIVFICYKKGLFKLLLIFFKTITSFFIASFFQKNFRFSVSKFIPINFYEYDFKINNFLSSNIIDYFKNQTNSILGTFVIFLILFIISYIILTILGNIINNIFKMNFIFNFINKICGIGIGLFLGIISLALLSNLIGLFLIFYNPNSAFIIISKSFFLKTFFSYHFDLIFENIIKKVSFFNNNYFKFN